MLGKELNIRNSLIASVFVYKVYARNYTVTELKFASYLGENCIMGLTNYLTLRTIIEERIIENGKQK